MNKAIKTSLPILATLALTMTFTLSCSSNPEELLSGSSGGQSSSSVQIQSSSSSQIPDMCCPPSSCYIYENCLQVEPPHPGACQVQVPVACPDVCAPPVLIGNEWVCAAPNQSSSSVEIQSSSSSIPIIGPSKCCPHPSCYDCGQELCVCPQVCAPPVLIGNEWVCAAPNQSSSSAGKLCGETEYNIATHFCDDRDNKVYKYVKIGSQTWMAQNLNYAGHGGVCYDPCPECDWVYDCDEFSGAFRLYSGWGAMSACGYAEMTCIVPEPPICPAGWHLPSNAEWTELTNFVGSNAGTKLKATGASDGTDDYGFAAIPLNNDLGWWSSTAYYFGACPKCPEDEFCEYCRSIPASPIRKVIFGNNNVISGDSNWNEFNAIRCVKY